MIFKILSFRTFFRKIGNLLMTNKNNIRTIKIFKLSFIFYIFVNELRGIGIISK